MIDAMTIVLWCCVFFVVFYVYFLALDCRWRKRLKQTLEFIESMTVAVEHPLSEKSVELAPPRLPFVT